MNLNHASETELKAYVEHHQLVSTDYSLATNFCWVSPQLNKIYSITKAKVFSLPYILAPNIEGGIVTSIGRCIKADQLNSISFDDKWDFEFVFAMGDMDFGAVGAFVVQEQLLKRGWKVQIIEDVYRQTKGTDLYATKNGRKKIIEVKTENRIGGIYNGKKGTGNVYLEIFRPKRNAERNAERSTENYVKEIV